jgi:hypothetical protein
VAEEAVKIASLGKGDPEAVDGSTIRITKLRRLVRHSFHLLGRTSP